MGFNKERWRDGLIDISSFENKSFKGVRLGLSYRKKDNIFIKFYFFIYKNNKIISWEETHKLKLFSTLEVKRIMEKIGFKVRIYEDYKNKLWNKNSKKYVVFVGVK